MALEDSVNDLVTATTDLLNAVNVAKETLDDAVASADVDANTASASAIASANSAASALAIYGNTSVMNAAVASATASATTATTKASEASTSATQAAASASSAAAIVTGVASNRPSVRPSLLLDFANTKQLDPRVTFSRPTTATYYDGKTVVKAEENLLTYSQQLESWALYGTASVTANATTAPDGTNTADLVTSAATGDYIGQTATATLGQQYTFSVFVKNNTSTVSLLSGRVSSTSYQCALNWSGATLTSITQTTGTASFTDIGNGWYRVSIVFAAAESNIRFRLWAGDAASTTGAIYFWGAQLEQRSTVTAYTPTTTAPITNYIPALQTAVSNDARFDHDPVTGESKGLLLEEQRTNLLTYSEQFDNAAWAKTQSSITVNSNIAPDGTQTADKLVEASDTAQVHQVQSSGSTVTAGINYTTTFYLKSAERTKARVVYSSTGGVYAEFDLSTGSLIGVATGFSGGTATSASITSVGNGWYRCSVVGYAASGTTGYARVELLDSSGSRSYNGNGTSGLYIWGAQLEAGSFPTSYIPTVASQVTRSADSASMAGSNFSSWYRADEGTVYVDWRGSGIVSGNFPRVFAISDNTANNRIELITDVQFSVNAFLVRTSGVDQAALNFGVPANNTDYKIAGSYKFNDFATSRNGASSLTDASGTIPVVDRINIGAGGVVGANVYTGTIKRIAYYPKRLSNTELQGLTTS